MTNIRYPKAAELALSLMCGSGTRPTYSGGLKTVLVDAADYTYDAADQYLDDIPSGARVGTPQAIGSPTYTNGVLDGADVTFPLVTGDECELLAIYGDTGTEGTSPLLFLFDGATGLPILPSGGDIPVVWNGSGIASCP